MHDQLLDILQGIEDLKSTALRRKGLDHKELEEVQLILPRLYKCPSYHDGFAISITAPRRDGLNTAQLFHLDAIYLFWKHSRWLPVDAACLGASWLEIFAFYKAVSGPTFPSDYDEERSILLPAKSLRAQIRYFCNESKKLLHAYADSDALEMLRPSRAKGSRLEHYGIIGRVPCVSANLCLHAGISRLVHVYLASLVDAKPLDCNDSKLVRPCKLRMHKPPPWDCGNGNLREVVTSFQRNLHNQMLDNPIRHHNISCVTPIPNCFQLQCPHCSSMKQVRHLSGIQDHLEATVM